MAADFPDNPAIGDKFTVTPKEFVWNGVSWQRGPILPDPVLTEIVPASVSSGVTARTLTLNGNNFSDVSVAKINDVAVPTVFIAFHQMTCHAEPAALGAGSHSVKVRKGVVDSNALNLAVGITTLTSIAPATTQSTTTALTLTLTGTYFDTSSVVYVKGTAQPTTFVSITQLTAAINPSALTYGTWPVEVRTGALATAAVNLTVAMVPRVTSVTPLSMTQQEPELVHVYGTEFAAGNQITIDGAAVATTFVSITELTATVNAPYNTVLGQSTIAVNVVGSPSADQTISTLDPRCEIKSTFPDYFSDWIPDWDVEVWCNGLINTVSVVHIDGVPQATELKANVVGTEFMLLAHFDLTPYPNDTWIYLTVVNDGQHVSVNEWGFWVERIGLGKVGPKGPPPRETR